MPDKDLLRGLKPAAKSQERRRLQTNGMNEGKMPKSQTGMLRYRGRVDSPQAITRLEEVLAQLGEIYDACLMQYRLAERQDPDLFNSNFQQIQLTQLRSDSPEFATVYRRAQAGTIDRAEVNWNRYAHPKEGTKATGMPRFKGNRFRTIDITTSGGNLLTFTRTGRPKLKIKGIPAIRLKGHRLTPQDEQPNKITITLKGRRILVRLGYKHELPGKSNPAKATNPVGVDLGIALSIATSSGDSYQSPNEAALTGQIKDAQQKLTRIISSAVATKRAGVRAVINQNNRQILTAKGKPRTQIVWTSGEPPKSYLKARRLLADLHERRGVLRHDFRHRATTQVVKQAALGHNDLIAMEDLQVDQMTGSAQGTVEKPGRNVRQKAGLNRSILQQGWGEILTMLEYKAESAGIPTVRVNAQATSITCAACGHRDTKSRKSQALFRCTNCQHEDNADHNASVNIGDRGLLYFQKRLGLTIESLRLARSSFSGRRRVDETRGPARRPTPEENQEAQKRKAILQSSQERMNQP